ncbi:hypothetical protein ERJ75_000962300 [Trypanosoma vivax]|nr:hypothetical protein TRVL_06207 [Trypanosoma vivax]KAH8611490.1 hypothetical protein ERJ75_000962300 [Trypanosoma vivax]
MTDTVTYRIPRLTKEQIENQVNRLTRLPAPRQVQDPFPVCPTVKLPREKLEQVTQRVFYHYSQKHQDALREAQLKREQERGFATTMMNSSEIEDMVKRVYYGNMERRREIRKSGEERLLFKSEKKIPVIPLRRFVDDMYLRGLQRIRDREKKLYEKYILPTEIKTLKISHAQAQECGNRLSTKNE